MASYAARRLTRVVRELTVYPDAMLANLDALHGLIYSQRVLHKLIGRGMMREQAYDVVQRSSLTSWESGEHLREVLRRDPDNALSESELQEAFDPAWYLRYIESIYRRFDL